MIAPFLTWWLASLSAMLSGIADAIRRFTSRAVVVEIAAGDETIAFVRRRGRREPLTLGAAARLARRLPVVLCPAAADVLRRTHTVPAVPRREVQSILNYELSRITPFTPEELLWCWEAAPHPPGSGRLLITLTMIPRVALAPATAALGRAGIVADLVELPPVPARRSVFIPEARRDGRSPSWWAIPGSRQRTWTDHPRISPDQHRTVVDGGPAAGMTIPMRKQSSRRAAGITLLAAVCIGLAVISAMLPVLLQSRALARTEAAIAALQPTLRQIEALRQRRAVYREGARLLAEESRRVGDTLSILAAISQALPDNCYLTNLALQARHLTLSGRSPSAAHLITVLAADPAIRDPAFAAPVLRGDGPSGDVFLIKASVAP